MELPRKAEANYLASAELLCNLKNYKTLKKVKTNKHKGKNLEEK